MRKLSRSLAFVWSLVAVPLFPALQQSVSSPTPSSLLAEHLNARGGAGAWGKVSALARSQSTRVSITSAWRKAAGGYELRIDEGSDEFQHYVTRVFDGTAGSMRMNAGDPRPLRAEDIQALREETAFAVELLMLDSLGGRIGAIVPDTYEGRQVWRVAVKLGSGREFDSYLDTKTWLEVARSRGIVHPDGQSDRLWTAFTDYKAVGGILLPHAVNGAPVSWAVNPALPDGYFSREGKSSERPR